MRKKSFLLMSLVLLIIGVNVFAAPPAKPSHTIWIECEDFSSATAGKGFDDADCFAEKFFSTYGVVTEITWKFIAPETAYYSIKCFATTVAIPDMLFNSPYYWQIDNGPTSHFTGGTDREIGEIYCGNFICQLLTKGSDEWVLLEAGEHTFKITVSEKRGFPADQAITWNGDAISLKLESKPSIGVVKDFRLESQRMLLGQGEAKILFDVVVDDSGVPSPGSLVTLEIYDFKGNLVKTLCKDQLCDVNQHTFTWSGENSEGALVNSGLYFAFLRSVDPITGVFNKTRPLPISVLWN